MPFVFSGSRRGGRTLLATCGALLAFAAPASALEPVAPEAPKNLAYNPDGCVVDHVVSNPFLPWGDTADYALAPGGDLETQAAGWTLGEGVSVVDDNNAFYVKGNADTSSLRIPAGRSAVTEPMCIDERYPHFRMFVRNVGQAKRTALKVEVLFLDRRGRITRTGSGEVRVSSSSWTPTDELKIGLTYDSSVHAGAAPVSFRFLAEGGDWRVDDVYVDPFALR